MLRCYSVHVRCRVIWYRLRPPVVSTTQSLCYCYAALPYRRLHYALDAVRLSVCPSVLCPQLSRKWKTVVFSKLEERLSMSGLTGRVTLRSWGQRPRSQTHGRWKKEEGMSSQSLRSDVLVRWYGEPPNVCLLSIFFVLQFWFMATFLHTVTIGAAVCFSTNPTRLPQSFCKLWSVVIILYRASVFRHSRVSLLASGKNVFVRAYQTKSASYCFDIGYTATGCCTFVWLTRKLIQSPLAC